jgi:copper chaperone CopZ
MPNRFWSVQHIQLRCVSLCFYRQNAKNLLNTCESYKPETIQKTMMTSQHKQSQTTFCVAGIRCNHCESSIKLALQKVPGVKRVKVRKRKQVVIELDKNHKTSNLDLVTAIENAGYRLLETP